MPSSFHRMVNSFFMTSKLKSFRLSACYKMPYQASLSERGAWSCPSPLLQSEVLHAKHFDQSVQLKPACTQLGANGCLPESSGTAVNWSLAMASQWPGLSLFVFVIFGRSPKVKQIHSILAPRKYSQELWQLWPTSKGFSSNCGIRLRSTSSSYLRLSAFHPRAQSFHRIHCN